MVVRKSPKSAEVFSLILSFFVDSISFRTRCLKIPEKVFCRTVLNQNTVSLVNCFETKWDKSAISVQ